MGLGELFAWFHVVPSLSNAGQPPPDSTVITGTTYQVCLKLPYMVCICSTCWRGHIKANLSLILICHAVIECLEAWLYLELQRYASVVYWFYTGVPVTLVDIYCPPPWQPKWTYICTLHVLLRNVLMTYWQQFRLAGSTVIETILACVQLHICKTSQQHEKPN